MALATGILAFSETSVFRISKTGPAACLADLTPRRLYSEYRRHSGTQPVLIMRDNQKVWPTGTKVILVEGVPGAVG